MIIDTGLTENDLLGELARDVLASRSQPGDVTAAQLAEVTGLSVEICRKRLNQLANEGKLDKVKWNGRDVVYRRKA